MTNSRHSISRNVREGKYLRECEDCGGTGKRDVWDCINGEPVEYEVWCKYCEGYGRFQGRTRDRYDN